MKNSPVALINQANASGTVTSGGIFIGNTYTYSLHGFWGAGGTGSIVVQASNDDVALGQGTASASQLVTNWAPIPSGTIAVSGAGSTILNFDGVGYAWLRAVYTATGGTATTMALNYFGKGP